MNPSPDQIRDIHRGTETSPATLKARPGNECRCQNKVIAADLQAMPHKPRIRLSRQTRRFMDYRRKRSRRLQEAAADRKNAFLELQYAKDLKKREPSALILEQLNQEPVDVAQYQHNYNEAVAHQKKAKSTFRHV
jgi:hypothetical protein